MKFKSRVNSTLAYVAIITAMAVCLQPTEVNAGMFQWGDYADGDVMFLDVTENNSYANSLFAPMPGTGGPIVAGNSLHFDPQAFAAQSITNANDLVDSTLTTTIMAGPNSGIENITISEFGDYSLGGGVGGQAMAEVGAAFFWTVLEVDNQAVNFATQATNLILGTGSGPNGGQYARPGDDGTAVIWSGTANIDLGGFLDSMQIAGDVTKVRLTFDNTLQTFADDVSSAFIKKKSIDIDVDTTVPEPTTALLFGLGLAIYPCCRRR